MSQVVFRRIGGRIVPIKMENDNHGKKAAGYIAAGAAIAHTTGRLSAEIMEESAKRENISRNTAKIFQGIKKNVKGEMSYDTAKRLNAIGRKSIRMSIESKRLEKRAFRTRDIGTAAAGALIGLGTKHALQKTALKDHEGASEIAGAAAGVASVFLVRSSYLRGVGHRGKAIFKGALKRALKRG